MRRRRGIEIDGGEGKEGIESKDGKWCVEVRIGGSTVAPAMTAMTAMTAMRGMRGMRGMTVDK